MKNPFRYFKTSPEVIRLTVMMYIRFPLSLRNVEDLLHERGINICHETVRYWWNRFGPVFAAEIRKRRISRCYYSLWRWHVDEVFVRINGELHYLWRAVDHEGEVLEAFVFKTRDKEAALRLLKKAMKRYGKPEAIVTDRFPSYRAAMKEIGNQTARTQGSASTIGLRIPISPSDDESKPWRGSDVRKHFRNSCRFTLRSQTISVSNVISIQDTSSSKTVRPLLLSG